MQPTDPSTMPFNSVSATPPFSGMLQAVGGLRNTRALIAWLGCAVAGVIVAGVLAAMAGFMGGFAFFLAAVVFMVALGTGVNAAGLLQMDQARGVPLRSLSDALVYGLMCIPKLIVLGLAFFAVTLVFFIALALVFVLCKIPFLGPVLYAVVFPVAVVATGVLTMGLFACMLLSLPAIWEGSRITRALAQTFAIVRSRLVETVLLFAVVGLLCFAVALIVFGVLMNGLMPVLALSGSILGSGGAGMGSGPLDSMMMSAAGGSAGYVIAGGIGFGVLWSVAGALVGQVYLQGLNLVYLRVTAGLDVGAAEAALQRKLDEAKQRSGDLAAKARAAATPAPAMPSAGSATDSTSQVRATAAAANAAAAYGGHPVPPPTPSRPPGYTPPAYMPPPSPMASPPAYAAPPVTRPIFDFPAPPNPGASEPSVMSSSWPAAIVDLPGAAIPVFHTAPSVVEAPLHEQASPTMPTMPPSAAPLDLEFDFELPGTPSVSAAGSSSSDAAPTMPLRGARDNGTTLPLVLPLAATPVMPPFPSVSAPPEPEPAPAMGVMCPKCLSAASPYDVFCSVCGNRLR